MEGQRHNNPLTRVAFVYNGPKRVGAGSTLYGRDIFREIGRRPCKTHFLNYKIFRVFQAL